MNDSFKPLLLFKRMKYLVVLGYLHTWNLSEYLCE